jgi:hypothetical protein
MLVARTPPQLRVQHFTDPACPFAFSHEPIRWRLRWLYGDALAWRPRVIGIAESVAEMEARGLTPALLANVRTTLAARHGMPIVVRESERLRATRLAALAVVGVRLAAPRRAERLLRALRVLAMAGAPIDERDTLAAAASRRAYAPPMSTSGRSHRLRPRRWRTIWRPPPGRRRRRGWAKFGSVGPTAWWATRPQPI